jgi:hypothetical protein
LQAITATLRLELLPQGIQVCDIVPTALKSNMTEAANDMFTTKESSGDPIYGPYMVALSRLVRSRPRGKASWMGDVRYIRVFARQIPKKKKKKASLFFTFRSGRISGPHNAPPARLLPRRECSATPAGRFAFYNLRVYDAFIGCCMMSLYILFVLPFFFLCLIINSFFLASFPKRYLKYFSFAPKYRSSTFVGAASRLFGSLVCSLRKCTCNAGFRKPTQTGSGGGGNKENWMD